MEITPDLIPHTEFHKGQWLMPVNGADWYYFAKKKNSFIVTDNAFLASVDKPLRALVKFFLKKKIKTTPSCAGHHYGKSGFDKIYDDLLIDMHKIRKEGLELKDVETGKVLLFKDPRYQLPWNKEEFLKKVTDYQQKGVLGFEAPVDHSIKKDLLNIHVAGAEVIEENNLFFILTDNSRHGYNSGIWEKLTRQVKSVFARSAKH